jgi:hypothetical protein
VTPCLTGLVRCGRRDTLGLGGHLRHVAGRAGPSAGCRHRPMPAVGPLQRIARGSEVMPARSVLASASCRGRPVGAVERWSHKSGSMLSRRLSAHGLPLELVQCVWYAVSLGCGHWACWWFGVAFEDSRVGPSPMKESALNAQPAGGPVDDLEHAAAGDSLAAESAGRCRWAALAVDLH